MGYIISVPPLPFSLNQAVNLREKHVEFKFLIFSQTLPLSSFIFGVRNIYMGLYLSLELIQYPFHVVQGVVVSCDGQDGLVLQDTDGSTVQVINISFSPGIQLVKIFRDGWIDICFFVICCNTIFLLHFIYCYFCNVMALMPFKLLPFTLMPLAFMLLL